MSLRTFTAVLHDVTSLPIAAPLTAVSYNILANKYAVSGYHSYCDEQHLQWSYRGPRVLRELRHYDADLVFLQEVEGPTFVEEILPTMARWGYTGVQCGRLTKDTDPVTGPSEGPAVLWKTTRFSEVKHEFLRFKDKVPAEHKAGSFWGAVREREDTAILVHLLDIAAQRSVVAAGVHLFWDPRWPDIKVVQAQVLCAELSSFARAQCGNVTPPIIIGGDFNSLWRKYRPDPFDQVPNGGHVTSGVYELLSSGRLSTSHHDHPLQQRNADMSPPQEDFTSSNLQLQSSFMARPKACEPPLTTKTATFAGCLDYIWLSQGSWRVTHLLALPYEETSVEPQEITFPAVPNSQFPSDHLAVGCRVEYSTG